MQTRKCRATEPDQELIMCRPRMFAGTLALAVAIGACAEGGPLEPSMSEFGDDELAAVLAAESGDAGLTSDDRRAGHGVGLFDALAAEIPGFGGLYRTQRCSIVVVLTERDGWEEAVRIVHDAVLPLVGERCASGIRVEAQAGRFTYLELQRYLHAARPLSQVQGVYGVHIDYSLNRLVFVVATREVMRHVLASLPRVGIPADAVTFKAAVRGAAGRG
jgi:hypothetical protein